MWSRPCVLGLASKCFRDHQCCARWKPNRAVRPRPNHRARSQGELAPRASAALASAHEPAPEAALSDPDRAHRRRQRDGGAAPGRGAVAPRIPRSGNPAADGASGHQPAESDPQRAAQCGRGVAHARGFEGCWSSGAAVGRLGRHAWDEARSCARAPPPDLSSSRRGRFCIKLLLHGSPCRWRAVSSSDARGGPHAAANKPAR